MKRAYYYFFYKIYKSIEYTSEEFGEVFWTGFKASLVIIALEIWFTASILNYYNIFIDRNINFSKSVYIGIVLFFSILSYITTDCSNAWKKYNAYFDNLPKNKNRIGSWLVLGIVVLIISNFIYSIYLMSQIDWSPYK